MECHSLEEFSLLLASASFFWFGTIIYLMFFVDSDKNFELSK